MERWRRRKVASPKQGAEKLSRWYRTCLRTLEDLPENRSGADKTWVEEALRSFRDHYRQARRVR